MATRLRSRLTWHSTGTHGIAALARDVPSQERVDFDTPAAAHERAIELLHVGAEIEHALMVQYLYAGYSLDERQATDTQRALVKEWRSVVLEIAREEMGHLATVQNLLTLIGGPLCFEREDFPIIDANLWPFPLQLEPLTKDSLAKYVLAEMPSEEVLMKVGLVAEVDTIKQRLNAGNVTVHRVGLLYGELLKVFTEGPLVQGPLPPGAAYPFVATADIQADSLPYQVSSGAWGLGNQRVLIDVATDRKSALRALTKLSEQGEGPIKPTDPDLQKTIEGSHFFRFLKIYRAFPEPSEWSPARPVATNPTTRSDADPKRQLLGPAYAWATLANLRYRLLLTYLEHSFYIEAPGGHPTRSPRAALVSWTFGEMYQLRTLAEILMGMPMTRGGAVMAGPPFEMPYTLSLPTRSANRWRVHRDLLLASRAHVETMIPHHPTHERYLRALYSADTTALDQICVLIGA